jgi:hypothetical protein
MVPTHILTRIYSGARPYFGLFLCSNESFFTQVLAAASKTVPNDLQTVTLVSTSPASSFRFFHSQDVSFAFSVSIFSSKMYYPGSSSLSSGALAGKAKIRLFKRCGSGSIFISGGSLNFPACPYPTCLGTPTIFPNRLSSRQEYKCVRQKIF